MRPNSLVAHQQHLKLLDVVDQELPEAAGQHVLGFLVAPITDVGHQDLALESLMHPVICASSVSVFKIYFRYIFICMHIYRLCIPSIIPSCQ